MSGAVDHASGWALNLETVSAMSGACQHNTSAHVAYQWKSYYCCEGFWSGVDPVCVPAFAYPSVCSINGDLLWPFPQNSFDVQIWRARFHECGGDNQSICSFSFQPYATPEISFTGPLCIDFIPEEELEETENCICVTKHPDFNYWLTFLWT